MVQKKYIYILLPISIGIWVYIIFKIVSSINSNESPAIIDSTSHDIVINDSVTLNTFKLYLDYEDPFITTVVDNSNEINKKEKLKKMKLNKSNIVVWPDIDFQGMMVNPRSKKESVNITINGDRIIMYEGEECCGIKVLLVYPDSIKLQFDEEVKTILL